MLAPQNNTQNMPQNMWYVQVNGQTYGPYPDSQMKSFVAEGRVNAQSIISQNQVEGFTYAAQFQSFLGWSAQPTQPQQTPTVPSQVLRPISSTNGGVLARQIQPSDQPQQAMASAPTPQPQYQPQPQIRPQAIAQTPAVATTVFMVMAEIRSANGMQFLQALQTQGTAQRIGDAVWLLQSSTTVEQLRNILSQSLTRDDRLFLLDSFANKTAWFNIGSDMDKRVRELWDIQN